MDKLTAFYFFIAFLMILFFAEEIGNLHPFVSGLIGVGAGILAIIVSEVTFRLYLGFIRKR